LNAELAYIAGFFDGEGCVHGSIIHKNSGAYPRAWITIGQKDPFILRKIEKYFNFGTLHQYKKNWRYQVKNTKEVIEFLQALYPYLIGKKEQAGLAIELNKRILKQPVGVKLKDEEREIRMNHIKRITELKEENITDENLSEF
jgi:hypothetical protein